jgi:5-oxoprolinase (ATP-hydrolysing)
VQEPSSAFYSAQTRSQLTTRLDALDARVRKELQEQGFEDKRVHVERMLNMRFDGTDTVLMVLPEERDGDGKEDFEAAFRRVYKNEFGFLLDTKSVVVDDIKVRTIALLDDLILVNNGAYGVLVVSRFAGSARRSTRLASRSSRR